MVIVQLLIDRSGSMGSIRDDVVGGIQQFIASQKEIEGKCLLAYSQFDHILDHVYPLMDIHEVDSPTQADFVPRGTTALYDAWGEVIVQLEKDIDYLLVKPEQVIFAVITDGYENSSKDWNKKQVINKVLELSRRGWTFTYLAADQDAMQEGVSLGINPELTYSFDKSSEDIAKTFGDITIGTTSAREKELILTKEVSEKRKIMFNSRVGISVLEEKTISEVIVNNKEGLPFEISSEIENDFILFTCTDNSKYIMTHEQDCCESVYLEDVCGDIQDLVGSQVWLAEEKSNEQELDSGDHETWTFYTIRTKDTTIDIRWGGSSNGYYSESADIFDLTKKEC